jgi:hypothetical protein
MESDTILKTEFKVKKMIKKIMQICFVMLGTVSFLQAQETPAEAKYRRSSLSMILVESENFPNKAAVMGSWDKYPFPDKYNKHDVSLKNVNLETMKLSDKEMLDAGFLKDTLKTELQLLTASVKRVKYLNNEKTLAVVLPSENDEYRLKIDKVIKEKKLANQLVESWFIKDGKFDLGLIGKRGSYDASQIDAGYSKDQARGSASLQDAGYELISNTFTTFTKLKFIENEPVARVIRDVAKAETAKQLAGKPQFLIDKAMQALDKVYEKTKEGYTLYSNTWLYKLSWNENSLNSVYDIWDTPSELAKSDKFNLEFVNFQSNMSLVTFSLGETRTQEQIIDLALVRNVDNAFAKLQKENDVFKPRIPVLTGKPLTAQIGMKEGLEGGEKFDLLELGQDPKTGLSVYKKVGSVKVDKKQVWDNRYNAGGKPEKEQMDKQGNPINATLFSGKAELGLLLKQVK